MGVLQRVQIVIQSGLAAVGMMFAFIVMTIVSTVAPSACAKRLQTVAERNKMNKFGITGEDMLRSINISGFRYLITRFFNDARYMVAVPGTKAPDITVLSLDGKSSYKLLDFVNIGRPLVIDEFKQLLEKYAGSVDFVMVYLQEAHAQDGWVFPSNPYSLKTHKTLEDRLSAAKVLADQDIGCSLVVDSMTDDAGLKYGALPDRLAVIENDVLVYLGAKGPDGYSVEAVDQWLTEHLAKSQ